MSNINLTVVQTLTNDDTGLQVVNLILGVQVQFNSKMMPTYFNVDLLSTSYCFIHMQSFLTRPFQGNR